MAAEKPVIQKRLGKTVKGFDEKAWDRIKYSVVLRGNTHNYTQHPELRATLLETGDRLLAEASRFDRVWAIGFDESNAEQVSRKTWGQNLLGKAIMQVREQLRDMEAAMEVP